MKVNPPPDKPVGSKRESSSWRVADIVNPPRDKPVASKRDLLSWRVADIVTLHGTSPWHLVRIVQSSCTNGEPGGACYRTDMGSAKIIFKRVYVLS